MLQGTWCVHGFLSFSLSREGGGGGIICSAVDRKPRGEVTGKVCKYKTLLRGYIPKDRLLQSGSIFVSPPPNRQFRS